MTSSRRRLWWFIFGGAAASILAASFFFDDAVREWLLAQQSPAMRTVMRYISWLGDWVGHAVGALLVGVIAHRRGNRRVVQICVAMLVALALAGVVARVVKIAAGRARPSVEFDSGFKGPRFTAKYHAFPSGHTTASLAFFGVVAFAHPRLFAALLPIPFVIGFARMYVGAHYLSDVLAGAVLGMAIAFWVGHWRRFDLIRGPSRVGD